MMSPGLIHAVIVGGRVEQVFARLADAELFAREHPGARISPHRVRSSIAESVVVFERRVVLSHGTTVYDRTTTVHQFVDDVEDAPALADVEWFFDHADSSWHIGGFGLDEVALDAKVQDVIDRVRSLDRAPAPAVAGAGASS